MLASSVGRRGTLHTASVGKRVFRSERRLKGKDGWLDVMLTMGIRRFEKQITYGSIRGV